MLLDRDCFLALWQKSRAGTHAEGRGGRGRGLQPSGVILGDLDSSSGAPVFTSSFIQAYRLAEFPIPNRVR